MIATSQTLLQWIDQERLTLAALYEEFGSLTHPSVMEHSRMLDRLIERWYQCKDAEGSLHYHLEHGIVNVGMGL